MEETTAEIHGMMYGMCESHVNDAIRKAFDVRKVSASRRKKQAVILSDQKIDEDQLRTVIEKSGYDVGQIASRPYVKKGWPGRRAG